MAEPWCWHPHCDSSYTGLDWLQKACLACSLDCFIGLDHPLPPSPTGNCAPQISPAGARPPMSNAAWKLWLLTCQDASTQGRQPRRQEAWSRPKQASVLPPCQQDRLHNLRDPWQNEKCMPLVPKLVRLSRWYSRALNQVWGPSKHESHTYEASPIPGPWFLHRSNG